MNRKSKQPGFPPELNGFPRKGGSQMLFVVELILPFSPIPAISTNAGDGPDIGFRIPNSTQTRSPQDFRCTVYADNGCRGQGRRRGCRCCTGARHGGIFGHQTRRCGLLGRVRPRLWGVFPCARWSPGSGPRIARSHQARIYPRTLEGLAGDVLHTPAARTGDTWSRRARHTANMSLSWYPHLHIGSQGSEKEDGWPPNTHA